MTVSKGIALLLLSVAAAAIADEPKPCCAPKQWVQKVVNVDAFKDNDGFFAIERTTRTAYDAINEKVAEITEAYSDRTREYATKKTIEDYKEHKMYVIQNGVCEVENLPYDFSEICVPAVATFDGTVHIGLGDAFRVNSFRVLVPTTSPNVNLLVHYSVEAERCIPFQLKLFAVEKSSYQQLPKLLEIDPMPPSHPFYKWLTPVGNQTTQKVSSAYQYSDFKDGIADPSFWFDPPASCHPKKHDATGGGNGIRGPAFRKRLPTRKKFVVTRDGKLIVR